MKPSKSSLASLLRELPPAERTKILEQMRPESLVALRYAWRFWGRPEQFAPGTPDAALARTDWTFWLLLAGRGFGKLLRIDTPIPTPSGWTRLGDIRIGDAVFDESGRVCHVLRTFDAIPQEAYRLHFCDGTHLDACAEHQWVTWTHAERNAFLRSPSEDTTRFPPEWPAWRKHGLALDPLDGGSPGPRVRTTQQLIDTLTDGEHDAPNHCIPTCGALQLPDARLPVDPWVLGAWLGNGSLGSGDFTAAPDEQAYLSSRLAGVGYPSQEGRAPQTIATSGLGQHLAAAGRAIASDSP